MNCLQYRFFALGTYYTNTFHNEGKQLHKRDFLSFFNLQLHRTPQGLLVNFGALGCRVQFTCRAVFPFQGDSGYHLYLQNIIFNCYYKRNLL